MADTGLSPDGAGSPGGGRYGEQVFRPDQGGEGDRIDLGALTYDDTTMARLRTLGAGPGWTCLDVGAGTGTVARRLLAEAGVAEVLAVDRDVRFLAAHPVTGLTVLQADVTADDFAPGPFRLVHARFLLMHLPSPQHMVARLSRLLAPGGVLVVSDAVDLTTASAPSTPYTRAMRAMWQGLRESIGTDVSHVPRHPELLRGRGWNPWRPRSTYHPSCRGARSAGSGPIPGSGPARRWWGPASSTTQGWTRPSPTWIRPGAPGCPPACSRPGAGSPRPSGAFPGETPGAAPSTPQPWPPMIPTPHRTSNTHTQYGC